MKRSSQLMVLTCYKALLQLYPQSFRTEYGSLMVRLFQDLASEFETGSSLGKTFRFGVFVLNDTIQSSIRERMAAMKNNSPLSVLMAALLLIPAATFAFGNILAYNIGVAQLIPTLDFFFPRSWVTDLVLLSGPPLAIAIISLSLLRSSRTNFELSPAGVLAVARENQLASVILAGAILILSIFSIYFVMENWYCLVGLAESC